MTTITTGPNGERPDIIARLQDACVGHPHARIPWPHRLLHDAIAEITSLRHLSAQPDPLTVTGMLRWEDNGHLYFGKIYVGREYKDMFGHYQAVPENWVSIKRIDKPTREEARDALVHAVKEVIGG